MKNPKVSVLLCVYNGEKYLEEAMKSILEQTYKNWECIVIDDCSSDRTPQILAQYEDRDSRIKIYRNKENLKLPSSLNKALSLAKGIYVIRMDADDICRRDRFEKQVMFMEENPDLTLSCCRAMGLVDNKVVPTNMQVRGDCEAIPARFLFFNPIIHPGVIARRKELEEFCYCKKFSCTEDFDLWIRMLCRDKKMAVQNDYLLLYRQHKEQITVITAEKQIKQYQKIIQTYYNNKLFRMSTEQLEFLTYGIYYRKYVDLKRFFSFLKQIREANNKRNKISKIAIEHAAIDLILVYKAEFHKNQFWLLSTLRVFSPLFIIKEAIRRKKEFYKALKYSSEAAKEFQLIRVGRVQGTKIPYYKYIGK